MSFKMYVPTRILFGAGELNNLHTQKMPGKKALIVISSGKSARSNGYLAITEEQLKLAGIETVVFDKVEANPLRSTFMAGGGFAMQLMRIKAQELETTLSPSFSPLIWLNSVEILIAASKT